MRRAAAVLAGALLIVLAGWPLSPSGGEETHQFDVVIAQDSYAFDPSQMAIEVGDTVRWRNEDTRRHLTASIPGSGPGDHLEILCEDLYAGKACLHTFEKPGRYPYFCFIHNRMRGEVVVLDR